MKLDHRVLWILSIIIGCIVFSGFNNYHLPFWLWATTVTWAATVGIWAGYRR